jgi:hypothetical protein
MTRLSFKLREGLAEDVARRVLGADFERASDVFYTALDKIKESAGLNYDQYCELESAANGAMYDLAEAAFVAGFLAGRDPLSLILQSTAGDEDQNGEEGEGGDV